MSKTVWVVDSVALVDIKREATANDQWDLMKRLETLVEDGTVVISEQVAREARAATAPSRSRSVACPPGGHRQRIAVTIVWASVDESVHGHLADVAGTAVRGGAFDGGRHWPSGGRPYHDRIMVTPGDALDRLREMARIGRLSRLCDHHDLDLFVVHGSVLDAEPLRPPADLDLAFRGARGGRPDVVDLVNDLLRLLHFDDVDLMDLGRAGPVPRARALAPDSLVLYESEPGVFATAQMAAITEAMETRDLRRRDLALMANR